MTEGKMVPFERFEEKLKKKASELRLGYLPDHEADVASLPEFKNEKARQKIIATLGLGKDADGPKIAEALRRAWHDLPNDASEEEVFKREIEELKKINSSEEKDIKK